MTIRAATAEELEAWDERTVDQPGGHVFQSRAYALDQEAAGWRPHHLVFDDGFAVLALSRPWPAIGGGSAYLPRGPIAAGEPPERTAGRLAAIAAHLADEGVDVVASDAEVPAASGYPDLLAANDFRPIEEIQPSRHRISLPFHTADEAAVFDGISKSTRQRIRKAEQDGIVVVRHDARIVRGEVGKGFVAPDEPVEVALDRFYDLLLETGARRDFSFGPRAAFLGWWRAAHRAGYLALLESRAGGQPLAGLLLYRHGERLSTVHSGDHAGAREEHPGALHLLRWRAIELALREGRAEMDLGGVDVAGARREPREGEPMWGLYQHKLSFGGTWLELTGAREKVVRPQRYVAGRLVSRLKRLVTR